MSLKYFGILVAILAVELAVGQNRTIQIKYKKVTAKTTENSYFKDVSTEIFDSGEKASMKFTIAKQLPETTTVSLAVELKGETVVDFEDSACELMKNEAYGKDMLNHGLPKDKFPKNCPIISGDFEVSKYPLPKDSFPPGTPPGEYNAKIVVGEPGQEPWVIVDALMEVSHDAPGVPAPKLGR